LSSEGIFVKMLVRGKNMKNLILSKVVQLQNTRLFSYKTQGNLAAIYLQAANILY